MKDNLKFLLALLLIVGAALPSLLPSVAHASYSNYIRIEVLNNQSTALEATPVLVTINHTQLINYGYINSSGLNTNLIEVADRSYMPASDRLGVYAPSFAGYQGRVYYYRLNNAPPQSSFPLFVGVGGNVSNTDSLTMELGNNWEIDLNGYLNTHATTINGTNIIYEREGTIQVYVNQSEQVEARLNQELGGLTVFWYRKHTNASTGTIQSRAVIYDGNTYKYGAWKGSSTVWTIESETWATNPWTSNAWTSEEINALEIGVELYSQPGAGEGRTIQCAWINASYGGNNLYPNGIGTANEIIQESPVGTAHWILMTILNTSTTISVYAANPDTVDLKDTYQFEDVSTGWLVANNIAPADGSLVVACNTTQASLSFGGSQYDQCAFTSNLLDNSYSWDWMADETVVYADYIEVTSNATQRLLWDPVEIVDPDSVTDLSGNGNTGFIYWGTNPTGIEITIGELVYFEDLAVDVGGDEEPEDVFLPSDTTGVFPNTSASIPSGIWYEDIFEGFGTAMGSSLWIKGAFYLGAIAIFIIMAVMLGPQGAFLGAFIATLVLMIGLGGIAGMGWIGGAEALLVGVTMIALEYIMMRRA